ncbi:MAG: Rrf2 family transcriptional regulator [Alphaproteobacteria bacterium]|nr:MAG: Rrf2 family transcriptional regulator [Alphaproteobacteria bacterium]
MIRISKKMYYAVDAVLHIALTQNEKYTISSRALADAQQVSTRYMEQTLQQLVRRGILIGTRGPRGGYRLARPPEQITIGDILAGLRRNGVGRVEDIEGSPAGQAVLIPLFDSLVRENIERLDRITIADLISGCRNDGRRAAGDARGGRHRPSAEKGSRKDMAIA